MKAYLENLVSWLFKWHLKMNASKCSYTIFSLAGRGNVKLDLRLNGESIPYNPNPVFLGITFDEIIGSIFDYSFFSIACISETNLKRIQTVQNRAIRCIHRLKWDSPTSSLFKISEILPLNVRFIQISARYLAKTIR